MTNFTNLVADVRSAFDSGRSRPVAWRKRQLEATIRMLEENEQLFIEALNKDLRKPKFETCFSELDFVKNEFRTCLRKIDEWTKWKQADKTLPSMLDKPMIIPEPYGVVLIMGSWNYPVHVTLAPMGGALSAGNCVILKPSEISENTAKLLEDLVPRYLDPQAVVVANGGIPETTALLKERFDYICYTGSTHVGKIVGEAANKHLTPCTLELGGKSPVFIDDTVDFQLTAKRLLWGKLVNSGQTCVAPDFVLCSPDVEKKLVAEMRSILTEWYGKDIRQSPDLCRIVTERHFDRLVKLLDASRERVVLGGAHDRSERFIEPTVLSGVAPADPVMQEEIFGPILPIVHVGSAREAVRFINARHKPLSLYVYSKRPDVQDLFVKETSSGSVAVNDNVLHIAIDSLPFGGVGNSGYGAYHGDSSFDTFTHYKSVLYRDQGWLGELATSIRYPPYNDTKISLMSMAGKSRWFPNGGITGYLVSFALGAVAMAAAAPGYLW